MMNHEHVTNCQGYPPKSKCSNGSYVLLGFRSMNAGTDDPDTYQILGEDPDKIALFTKLDAIPTPTGNLAHPFQGKELYFEFFRYLTGQGVYNGHNGFVDYGDSPSDTTNLDAETPALEVLDLSHNFIRSIAPVGALTHLSGLIAASRGSQRSPHRSGFYPPGIFPPPGYL